MNSPLHGSATKERSNSFDMLFASGIVLILSIFFLPTPPILIDLGLALSVSVSVLILMVALWIEKPLEFSAFPTILLVSTMLRLSLNIATTRLILSHGSEGISAAGYVIGGFARLVMSGDFVIGIVVFTILITVNFLVITKGATRIAEVGARFTLDAIPGKQMAIDADLSAGLIDDKQAQARRRELEEESAFFGSMDGASKFVRGDAIAGLIILAVNIFGGILIGITRHNMSAADAVNIFTKLSVGDGLVSQIPALIVSLAAGLLVSKGGTRGSADQAVVGQLTRHPRALFLAGGLMFILALIPGLPFLPFALLGSLLAFSGVAIPRHLARISASELLRETEAERNVADAESDSVREYLRATEIELCIGQQLASRVVPTFGEMSHR
ncbi:MAG: FHIPEP family type III secretion protein, partial [Hyphomicrobiales bacterium]|nr:FHIPEP family type III secretion protein [Hyphomicrobiales bacterium]